MASAILRDRIIKMGLDSQVEVISAGVWAEPGARASSNGAAVLSERGVALNAHRSQPVTIALLEEASIVLVMEEAHRRSIFYLAPQHLSKVYLLTEMVGGHEDILDPYGGTLADYAATADLLISLIDKSLPRILKQIDVTPASSANTSAA